MNDKNISYFKTYVKGETLLGVWGFVGNVLAAVSTLLLVTHLSVFDYGVYVLVIAFYSLVSSLPLGLMQTVILNDVGRFIGAGQEGKAKKLFLENASFQIGIAILLSLATFAGADLVAMIYGKDIALLIRIISPLFVISATYTVMRVLLRARLQFGIIATRSVSQKIVRLLILGGFLLFGSLNVRSALIAYVGSTLVSVLVCVPPWFRLYSFWREVKATSEGVLWQVVKSYGKWSIFGEGLKSSLLDLRPWLLKSFTNTETVAVFSIAESMYGFLKGVLPVETLSALFPRLIHDSKRSVGVLLLSVKYLLVFTLLLGLAGLVFAPIAVDILAPQYSSSVPLFQMLLITLPLLAFRSPTAAFLVAHRKQKFIFVRQLVMSSATIILPLSLLPLFGVVGMAFERVISSFIITGITFWYLAKREVPASRWLDIFHFDHQDKTIISRLLAEFDSRVRRLLPKV